MNGELVARRQGTGRVKHVVERSRLCHVPAQRLVEACRRKKCPLKIGHFCHVPIQRLIEPGRGLEHLTHVLYLGRVPLEFGRTERRPGTMSARCSNQCKTVQQGVLGGISAYSSGGALTLNMYSIVVTRDTSHALRAELNLWAACEWAHAKSRSNQCNAVEQGVFGGISAYSSGGALTLNMYSIVVTWDTSHALRSELNPPAFCHNRGHMQSRSNQCNAVQQGVLCGFSACVRAAACAHVKHALHRRHPGHVPCIESRVERFGVLQQPWAHAKSR